MLATRSGLGLPMPRSTMTAGDREGRGERSPVEMMGTAPGPKKDPEVDELS